MSESISDIIDVISARSTMQTPAKEIDQESFIEALETPFHVITPCIAIGSYAGAQNPGKFATDDEKLMVVRVTHQKALGVYEIENYPKPEQWTSLSTCSKIKYAQWNNDTIKRNWSIWDMGQDLTDSKDAS